MHTVTNNQGKCCDAVLRILEAKFGSQREYIRRDEQSCGDVELVCRIGTVQFALEHTRIDPYLDRVSDDIRVSEFMEPIVRQLRLDPSIPDNSSFIIVFDVFALSKTKRREHKAMQAALIQWVRTTAPNLLRPPAGRITSMRAQQPPGLPFPLTLQRLARLGRKISFARFQPENLEEKRCQRINKALRDKLPKLAAYRRARMFTVLVLEDDDIAMSNHALIGVALHDQLPSIGVEAPDFIYLVETSVPSFWVVCNLKYESVIWPDGGETVVEYRMFDPAQLTDTLHFAS